MVGGGIFAVLGLAADLGKGGTPVAFLLAGIVALVTSYSYARLSVAFPSAGGTTRFLDKAFGGGLLSGGLNVLLWESYIVMIALYAYAFGSYGASYLPAAWSAAGKHALIIAVILLFTGVNYHAPVGRGFLLHPPSPEASPQAQRCVPHLIPQQDSVLAGQTS